MTTLDPDGVTVKALGKQAQSQRLSAPDYGISKVGRDAREKVFISEAHIRCGRLGRESPIGGAVYDLPSSLNPFPRIKFTKGSRSDLWGKSQDDPGDIPTNEALCIVPDSQPFKYRNQANMLIGTEPRGKLNQAELMKAHAAAFLCRGSPGPAAIGGDYGPDFKPTKERMAPARPFGVKTNKPDWMQTSSLPHNVGPGIYPRTDVAIGHQYLTQKRNQSVHEFPHGPKFAKVRSADSITKLDAARSSFGSQPLGKNKSEPSINFNCDSRKSRDRSMICYTKQDLGPVAAMPKQTFKMPALPSEKLILRGGIG